jgi:uncharacterized membrane protein
MADASSSAHEVQRGTRGGANLDTETGARNPGARDTGAGVGHAGLSALVFALLGLSVSIYLTIEHFTSSKTLACPESATINCAKVTTSAWSHIAGIPVAVLGLVYFVIMTGLTVAPVMRFPRMDRARVIAAAVGAAMVIYLVWVELFRVNAICLWCTAVHVCTIAMLGAVLWHAAGRDPGSHHPRTKT